MNFLLSIRKIQPYYNKTYYNKHVRNNIGNCAIVALNYNELRAFFNEKATCEQSLIEGIKKVLNATLKYALKCEYIQFNPLTLIKPKGREPELKEKLTQIRNLISSLMS